MRGDGPLAKVLIECSGLGPSVARKVEAAIVKTMTTQLIETGFFRWHDIGSFRIRHHPARRVPETVGAKRLRAYRSIMFSPAGWLLERLNLDEGSEA